MRYTSENIKYCLLTFDKPTQDHITSHTQEKMCISGLYHWNNIFKGEFGFPLWPEDTEKYNLIHVNITPRNIPLLDQILPMINRNKTKLLFNVDHSIHLWMSTFTFPQQLLASLDKADYIFGVEPIMCELLSDALKREVPCIPHPVDVELIAKRRQHERSQRVGVSIHRYFGNSVLPWYTVNELPPGWVATAIGADKLDFKPKIHHMYPEVQPYLKFEVLIEWLAEIYAVIESYFIASYGRLTAECAALAVPVIGSDIVGSQARCFPLTSVGHYDPTKMKTILNRLINDSDFYTEVVRYGMEQAEYYSLENSKERMLGFLNSGQ